MCRLLRARQLADEPIEDDFALADADRGIVEDGVERRWIARVVHADRSRAGLVGRQGRADAVETIRVWCSGSRRR